MKKRLLAVQGPLQFIAGYIAHEWYRTIDNGGDSDTVLLLYDFLASADSEPEIEESIRRLARSGKWSKVVFISADEMASIMHRRYSRSVSRIHDRLGESHFDEIFLARGYIGDGSPLLLNAYPWATRLTYGDSLGLVGQHEIGARFDWSSPVRSLGSGTRRALRRALWGGPKQVDFHAAVLTLPLDMSGSYLKRLPLVVPRRDHVVRCVGALHAGLDSLTAYSRQLLGQRSDDADHLYLLSNLSASGLTTPEKEVDLYVDVITQTAGAGSTIFIKHHPRSDRRVLDAVTRRVAGAYRMLVLDDDALSRVPIELWSELIHHCTVVAMFSTSAINIKYLYDRNVVIPLNQERIRRFFPSERVDYMTVGTQMIRSAIENLNLWDGQSVLWRFGHERA